MDQKITNTFIKGIQQDLGISLNNNQSITYGLDINIITNEGESTGIITNHKGNKLSFNLPNTQPIYIIELDGFTGTPFITINGVLNISNITTETTIINVYNELINNYSTYINNGEYNIYYNNQQIYIVGFSINPNVLIGPSNNGLKVTSIIPSQTDLSIIGWTTLGEDIVLFSTNKNNINLDPIGNNLNYYGQIWKLRYDKVTNTVISPNGTDLNLQDHLIYNNLLQFSLANEIEREAIGIVENSIKGTVYWTDNYNNPRAFNLYNPQSFAVPLELLDWKPNTQMSTPIITSIVQGGLNPIGAYQIAYQLYSIDGAVSNYSPASTVITLTDSTKTEQYQNYDGGLANTNSGKAIRFRVGNIDRNYDFIRFVAIRYELVNEPEIFSFLETAISNDTIEGVLNGNEDFIPITLTDFINPLISFDTCKTFTQKKNRLYPANTKSKKFNINYDSKAYRFNSSQQSLLYNINNTTTNINGSIPSPLYPSDDILDLINPYNDESGSIYGLQAPNYSDWINNQQYKYQTDGTTLGGEGPNIKYGFITKRTFGDQQIGISQTNVPFVTVNNNITGSDSLNNLPITELEHPLEGVNSAKNELINTIYVGYSRGEIYRFGIVFYNNKGEESFVNWIGDIRIPEPWEDSNFNLTVTSTGNNLELKQIGIKFTIKDLGSLPTNITGFRIVRMERTESNKTRFGSGLLLGAIKTLIDYDGSGIGVSPVSAFTLGYLRTGYAFNATGAAIPVNKRLHIYHNNDFFNDNLDPVDPIIDAFSVDVAIKQEQLGIIKFPEMDFDKYSINSGSYIRVLNEYDVDNLRYWDRNTSGTFNSVAEYYKLYNEQTAPNIALNRTLINGQRAIGIDGVVTSDFSSLMTGYDYLNINVYDAEGGNNSGIAPYNSSDCELSGFGSKQLFCEFNSTPTNSIGNDNRFRVVSLFRHNLGQYGGPWRYARYNNTYISCSDFIPINLLDLSLLHEIMVYGGDTYVNYYSTAMTFFHWKETFGFPGAQAQPYGGRYSDWAASMSASAFGFPVETTINTEMRSGEYWNKSQVFTTNGDEFAKFLSDDYTYNDIYSQQSNLKSYFSLPFNFIEDTNQSNFVWTSNRKITGEDIDNWRIYPSNDFLPLELTQGAINRIVNYKESLLAYQERGIANVSSEDRNSIEDTTGSAFSIGDGKILSRYDYISKSTGTLHQYSVVTTPNCVYHYDCRLNKFFQLKSSEGLTPLSDVKGLFDFFKETVQGNIKNSEQILLGLGIEGVYDSKYNKCYFTFLNKVPFTYQMINNNDNIYIITNYNPKWLYNILSIGNIYDWGYVKFRVIYISKTSLQVELISGSFDRSGDNTLTPIKFTISYNEILQAFESFYTFTPNLFISNDERLLSANPYDINNSVYDHYQGNYGVFYDKEPSVSQVEVIVNYPDNSKVPTFRLDNLDIWTECYDINDIDIPLETLSDLLIYTDYQTTGSTLLNLIPQNTIIRKERTWRVNKIFDESTPNLYVKPYFRNKFIKIRGMYNNQNNRYFKLHEINSNITLSYY